MNCPKEIVEAIVQILSATLLRIRNFAGQQNSEQCFIESDHAHNLPNLINNYSKDLLEIYLSNDRLEFIKQSKDKNFRSFEPYWKLLESELLK